MDSSILSTNHVELFRYLRTLVDTAEQARGSHPKFALVEAYWHIGRIIVETEQDGTERADYGIHLIEQLSERLTETFGKGYSLPNMWRFKQFYLGSSILSTNGRELTNLRKHLRIELTWSHYRLLMTLKNLQERAFYNQQAADEGWTVRLLQKLVSSRYYYQVAMGEEHLLAGSKKIALPGLSINNLSQPSQLVKSKRSKLAIIKKVLLERYVGYAFVGKHQYLSINGEDQWVELVFFHIVLQRYVLVQLGEHNPVDLVSFQQLIDTYVSRQPPEMTVPPIGLLINLTGQIKPVTGSRQPQLSMAESIHLPTQL